ncbi:SusC/RagA family TonB-linked outer membrane protein [Marinoscillum luteum]|uniref:SusC/RagA family TonB-linked outer membrane protein n=1 Tax=Marinoscillum luteum TaxID=861051 RepID=A0ABW7N7B2_9BACT
MKKVVPFVLLVATFCWPGYSQSVLKGTVTSAHDGQPLPGVTIVSKGTTNGVITDSNGAFTLSCPEEATLVFSYIGYETLEADRNGQSSITVSLTEGVEMLGLVEVYATGYEQIPAERATGSFEHIDEALITRSTGMDIISRLEGVTSGLLFDKRLAGDTYGEDFRSLRIRGVSSIDSDNSPLIVVDNFPYEGDISSINPNDIAHVTVLKDAAAASLWGARAANGVIVLTTKKGGYERPLTVHFTSNVTVSERPDLHYSPDYLPAADFIGVERTLFDSGFYNSTASSTRQYPLSPVVELLLQHRDGALSDAELQSELATLATYDVRDEAETYFYRPGVRQQYALSMEGGTQKNAYYFSSGYDQNQTSIDGNDRNRLTLSLKNRFRPITPLELEAGVNIIHNGTTSNGLRWGEVATPYPYTRLADDEGNWLPVVRDLRMPYAAQAEAAGLLDWMYRPLQEKALNDQTTKDTEYRLDMGAQYAFTPALNVSAKYQYQKIAGKQRDLTAADSYRVRHLVNRFTQQDGTRVFPEGAILSEGYTDQQAHALRTQLNYSEHVGDHRLSGLAGAEVRQVQRVASGLEVYGYDDEVLTFNTSLDYLTRYPVRPWGNAWTPTPTNYFSGQIDRYVSYYGNAAYTYHDRYGLTASVRWDASNLFGVKTNQKGVPLWSVGGSWDLSDEAFYGLSWLPYLRFRLTYGYNGNINKSVTAFPTARYSVDNVTNLPIALLRNPGNPALRWEKIGMVNAGVDFETKGRRISGSLEYYVQHGHDLIGDTPLDPTTGFITLPPVSYKTNFAETRTRGVDVQLHTVNVQGPFAWSTDLLTTWTANEILSFYNESITYNTISSALALNTSSLPQVGRPIDALYSLPWYGLDPTTGDPQVMIEDQLSTEYRDYVRNLEMTDLKYHGVSVPPLFGSVRNNFSWKGLTLSVNVSWKTGYYFRKSGLSYERLFENGQGHIDYLSRWQQPGDEQRTQVPSIPAQSDTYRDKVYTASELMIEPGDHIRLEDINLSYEMSDEQMSWLPMRKLRVFVYAKNLGMIWSATSSGLDPDYPNTTYLIPRSYAIGINGTF